MQMRYLLLALTTATLLYALPQAAAAAPAIPATRLLTLYQFNGALDVPFYDVDQFLRHGPIRPAGSLAQGSSVIPCLVVRDGKPVTDTNGTPFVGFDIVINAKHATPDDTARFTAVAAQRKALTVAHHHCPPNTRYVLDVRKLYDLGKPPRFDPPRPSPVAKQKADGELDAIVRSFHASAFCAAANQQLIGRKAALERAWTDFSSAHAGRWSKQSMRRARQLDFVLRTALFEGHLGRGCNAYGACERNAIVLSIRNRARERCLRGQGCRGDGDFEGVATAVSQYNIWDEFLTQSSALTSCFLRPDLQPQTSYAKLQAMYTQSRADAERILFGDEPTLQSSFPTNPLGELRQLRHYYHPQAMGKCFPDHPRLEYISGAVAQRGETYALIANTRVEVGERRGSGYRFRLAEIGSDDERDVVRSIDRYPGFTIDKRKITLRGSSNCTPHGTSARCRHADASRHRRIPAWLATGKPLALECRVRDRGATCTEEATMRTARVGGLCDKEMQPVAGVP